MPAGKLYRAGVGPGTDRHLSKIADELTDEWDLYLAPQLAGPDSMGGC